MATVQERNGAFRILFCHGDRRFTFTVGRVTRSQAEAHTEKGDELLGLLADATLALPEGADLVTFMLHKGRPPAPRTELPAPAPEPTLAGLREKYLPARGKGAMEANSLATTRMHLRRFEKTPRAGFHAQALTLTDLQRHVDQRLWKKYLVDTVEQLVQGDEVRTLDVPVSVLGLRLQVDAVGGRAMSSSTAMARVASERPFFVLNMVVSRLTHRMFSG